MDMVEEKCSVDVEKKRIFSTAHSNVSIDELIGISEDKSLQRGDEDIIRLKKCKDEVVMRNAQKYCSRCLGGSWLRCDPQKIDVEYISGGMTNYLYKCSLPSEVILEEHEVRHVLMRIYGNIVDMKQRFYECIIFTVLSERNIGHKVYGVFYSGRIEEYLPYRTLKTDEIFQPKFSKCIAGNIAEYHCMKLPLNKMPVILWENCEKYLSMIATISFDEEPVKASQFKEILTNFNFYEEYKWMRSMLSELNSPVLFCHNDVHEGNIMYIEEDNDFELQLIDFDYSSYNYRGFDIGNHFVEYIYTYTDEVDDGFITIQENYPSREQQVMFAEAYKRRYDEMRERILNGELDNSKYFCIDEPVIVDDVIRESNRFAIAACFYWAVWAISQAKISRIKMNYLKHTVDRIETYRRLKILNGF